MLQLDLAYKNLLGAGVRTWLNVIVTSISFVIIIFMTGMFQGLLERTKEITVATEVAGGLYWHPAYDPDDPMTIDDSHGVPPEPVARQIAAGQAMPILLVGGSAYPDGRMVPVILRGIEPGQDVISLPTDRMADYDGPAIPALIGSGMARLLKRSAGEMLTLRWRDADGTYDAADAEIVAVMRVDNFKIDIGQIYLPIERLREMAAMRGEATLVVVKQGQPLLAEAAPWVPKPVEALLEDIMALIEAKMSGLAFLYFMLLALSALGIFNSQVLAIFQRRREIGTLMALGMPRSQIVGLFTLEGAIHSILAVLLAALWGGPLLYIVATRGIALPYDAESIGLIIGERMFPVYGPLLIGGTTLLVAFIVTVVSYLPSRKIAKMQPTDSLRGTYA